MPNPHANETRLTHKPKIPPFPAQDPQAGHNPPAPPPSPHGTATGAGEGAGADPARLRILYRYFCFPSCLHILTGHDIYAFYIERTI